MFGNLKTTALAMFGAIIIEIFSGAAQASAAAENLTVQIETVPATNPFMRIAKRQRELERERRLEEWERQRRLEDWERGRYRDRRGEDWDRDEYRDGAPPRPPR